MAIAVTVNQVDFSAARFRVECTLTTSGTYTTGGVAIDWGAVPNIPTQFAPIFGQVVEIVATPTTSMSGSDYFWSTGTDLDDGTLQIFKGGTEHTNATAFPAATLNAVFWFPSL